MREMKGKEDVEKNSKKVGKSMSMHRKMENQEVRQKEKYGGQNIRRRR